MVKKSRRFFEFEEKFSWAEIMSAIAIAISLITAIVTPLLTYHYFEPKLEDYRIKLEESRKRPQIQVSKIRETDLKDIQGLRFDITNVGQFPAENLQIIISSNASDVLFKAPDKEAALRRHVSMYPDIKSKYELEDFVIRITLERPLAPKQVLTITIPEIPGAVSIQTGYGDMIQVYSSGRY
jgi:hypothetical protein